MNFLVVGPGAMGLLFSARLKRAGHRVILLDYKRDRAEELNKNGIALEGISGDFRERVHVEIHGPFEDIDYVLICVKAYNTKDVAESIKAWIPNSSILVTLQNGLGNIEKLQEIFGSHRVLGGVTSEGATLLSPGRVRHAGAGETIIGPHDPSKTEKLASALKEAGFNVKIQEDVTSLIWGKLIINVGINPFSAILRVRNGALPSLVKDLMESAVNEAVMVSSSKGIILPYENPFGKVLEVCEKTSNNIASMLQDVLKQRRTEIQYINGAIVKEGVSQGIPTPINRSITSLVLAIENSYKLRIQ
jgi:2-dehydropantoate 2-reductase